jgi:3-dehydroquinate synthase
MKAKISVETQPTYDVLVGAGVLADLPEALSSFERHAVLCDERVRALHGDKLALDGEWLELPAGEDSKSLRVLERVLDFASGAGLDRNSCLVTFGGGVMTDLGGLAASLFKRGIAVLHAPTTLLAQVDASVGGKTAVNLAAGKNLAGTFHQPRGVYCDTDTLSTLSDEDWLSGLGEVAKSAWIGGPDSLALLEGNAAGMVAREADAIAALVSECIWIKARVVAEDPLEKGARRALNLGHTFAHAIEKAAGYGTVPHGVAVACGLALAFELSRETGHLADESDAARITKLLAALQLPASLAELRARYDVTLTAEELLPALAHDKKGAVGKPEFVLPTRPGELELAVRLQDGVLEAFLGR